MEHEKGSMINSTEIGRFNHASLPERFIEIVGPDGGPKACQLLSELWSLTEEHDEEK